MTNSKGYRAGTRSKFAKAFRKHGAIQMSNYLTTFKRGEYVDIKVDGAIHKGMPHQIYHGRTAKVFNVNPRAIGVIVHKVVRYRKIEKRLNIRPEHLRKSSCRDEFLQRVKTNDKLKTEANKKGQRISTKRSPVLPRGSHTVSVNPAELQTRNIKPHIRIF
jgi:large subunit ribosomal protein L21e